MRADFLSIDCGVEANYSGDTDRYFGIVYVSDEPYTDAGENHRVAPDLESLFVGNDRTLRSFPSGQRNCYALPTVAGTKHLVRAFFAYGNYYGRSSSSVEFDLHLGANFWTTVYADAKSDYVFEAIFVAWAGWAPVCLVNTGRGTPFVSVLELRPLGDDLYPQAAPGLILNMYRRQNMGESVSIIRYVTCIFQLVLHVIETELWQIIFLQ